MPMGITNYIVVAASSADRLAEGATNRLTDGFQPLGPPAFFNGRYYMSMAVAEFAAHTPVYVISAISKKDPTTLTDAVNTEIGNGYFPFGSLVADAEGNPTQFLSDNLFAPIPRAFGLDSATATAGDVVTELINAGLMAGYVNPD